VESNDARPLTFVRRRPASSSIHPLCFFFFYFFLCNVHIKKRE
jgi:hypothetical protein